VIKFLPTNPLQELVFKVGGKLDTIRKRDDQFQKNEQIKKKD